MPPSSERVKESRRRKTLLLGAEDSAETTIKPRVMAAEGNPELIGFSRFRTGGTGKQLIQFPHDTDFIERVVTTEKIKLVIVDVLEAFLADGVDPNSNARMRKVLTPLADMAQRTGVTFLMLRHLNKKSGENPMYRGGGSIGITGASRAAFAVAADPQDKARKILACVRPSLAAWPPSLEYSIEPHGKVSRIEWHGESHLTADDVLRPSVNAQRKGQLTRAATELVKELLEDGPRPAKEVIEACEKEGMSGATVRRAKKQLKIKSTKRDKRGGWDWELPE